MSKYKVTIEITVDIKGMSEKSIKAFYVGHFKRVSTTDPIVKVIPDMLLEQPETVEV